MSRSNPLKKHYVIAGSVYTTDEKGNKISFHRLTRAFSVYALLFHSYSHRLSFPNVMPPQPAVFWHKQVFKKIRFLDETLKYAMDYDYWLRMMLKGRYKFFVTKKILAYYRFHKTSHSSKGWHVFGPEWKKVSYKYLNEMNIIKRAATFFYWLSSNLLVILAVRVKMILQNIICKEKCKM